MIKGLDLTDAELVNGPCRNILHTDPGKPHIMQTFYFYKTYDAYDIQSYDIWIALGPLLFVSLTFNIVFLLLDEKICCSRSQQCFCVSVLGHRRII